MGRGRPRQFDEATVLSAAARVFRERGFAGSSMLLLSSAMQMREQSIYNAFGSKQALFERALEHYCRESEGVMRRIMHADASRAEVEAYFSLLIDLRSNGEPPCLVLRTSTSPEIPGQAAPRRADRYLQETEALFFRAVKNAVAKGEIVGGDPRVVARYLTMAVMGLGVVGTGRSKADLEAVVGYALKALDGAAVPDSGR